MGVLKPNLGNANYCSAGQLSPLLNDPLYRTIGIGTRIFLGRGIGIPIPILNEEICRYTAVKDKEIWAPIVDYSEAYPQCKPGNLGEVNYTELKSGKILIKGKKVPTGSLSSYCKAKKIAKILKDWIQKGKFFLTEPVASLPGPETGYTFKPLKERAIK